MLLVYLDWMAACAEKIINFGSLAFIKYPHAVAETFDSGVHEIKYVIAASIL